MLFRSAVALFALLAWAGALHAQQKVAIIIRQGPFYSSPHLPQTPIGNVSVDSAFKIESERTDSLGRPWVELSNGAEKVWVVKNLCVVRHFVDWEIVQPFIKLVRSQSWSNFDKERVLKGVVDIAMTSEQVLLSWGEPLKIVKDPGGEEWVYGPLSLVFRTGVVSKIRSKSDPPASAGSQ